MGTHYRGYFMICHLLILLTLTAQAQPPTQVDVVASFGADPTWLVNPKATDSADAIQRALDAGAGITTIPPGKFLMTKPITIRGGNRTVSGASSGTGWGLGTHLYFINSIAGITVASDGKAGGGWVRIENIAVHMLYPNPLAPLADGLTMTATARVNRVWVNGFTGDGVRIFGQTPTSACNLWRLDDLQIDECGGDGVHVEGGDANGGVATGVSCTANGGWGILDASSLGNTYVACHTRTNKAGPYSMGVGASGVNASVLVGCYAEGDQPPSRLGDMAYWFGGTSAAGIVGGQVMLPGQSRVRFQSPGGPVPALAAMASVNSTGPPFAVLDANERPVMAVGPGGTLGLGTAAGDAGLGAGPASPLLSLGSINARPLARISLSAGNYVGPVGDVTAGADGDGYGSAWLSFLLLGTDARPHEALRLKGDRVTVGQGGLQLPALTVAQRAGLRSPQPGLVVFGVEERTLVVWDGQGWRAIGK